MVTTALFSDLWQDTLSGILIYKISDCSLVKFIYHLVLQYWSRTSENIVLRSNCNDLSIGDSFVKLSLRYPMTAAV